MTARAAILVLAVASVMLAVALPMKIWLGQRNNLAHLTAQTKQAEQRIAQLNAQHKRWNSPGYIEQQARQRLHYTLPGQKSYIVLGKGRGLTTSTTAKKTAAATGPWYHQFWQSDEAAGTTSAATPAPTKK